MSDTANPWPWLLGRETPPEERALSAGPLTATLSGLDIMDVRVGGVEVIRRLCVRVRDTKWGTIAPAISSAAVEQTPGGFAITMRAHHVGPAIDFSWAGRLVADAKGTLSFSMEGAAIGDCVYNRIGLIVLHPIPLPGAPPISVTRGDGTAAMTLPKFIEPVLVSRGIETPLIPAFDRLSLRYGDKLATTFVFEGDLFEMEDQRNWGDGSFKTFSTLLSVPTPLKLARGETLRQALHFSWKSPSTLPATAKSDGVDLTIGKATGTVLPAIGLSLDADGHVPSADEAALLRAIKPAHLRAEVNFTAGPQQASASLDRCARIAEMIGVPIELACHFPPQAADIREPLKSIAAMLRAVRPTRVALLPSDDTVTPLAWLEQASEVLGSDGNMQLALGTRSDFVELNRQRPPRSFDAGLAYAASAEVHDSDEPAIMQSLEGHAAAVVTVRAFAPEARIHVGPISLTPWPRRDAGAAADERQHSLFAAAWLAASVGQLAHVGAHSLSYFECTGPRGILARAEDGAPPTPVAVFHVFSYLARHASRPLASCVSSDPTRVYAVCFGGGEGSDLLVANLVPRSQTVTINGLAGGDYRLSTLTPNGFEAGAIVSGPGATLELGPYSVAALAPNR